MSDESSKKFDRSMSLKELMATKRKQMKVEPAQEIDSPKDPYEVLYPYLSRVQLQPAIGTSEDEMVTHKNDWDTNHPESPERWSKIMERIKDLGLLSRCKLLKDVEDETAIIDDIALVHNPNLVKELKKISAMEESEREAAATSYDAVYFNEDTYIATIRAVQWTLAVVKEVCEGKCSSGFAIVRPPGHHAKPNAFEGYCFFNNVAIAAEKCIREKKCKKIMIIDFDVHHGNGTQEIFYERNDVLYLSIHRYENGIFWPNLEEGNFHAIGKGEGKGYNINVPLNETHLEDSDYMAIVLNLIVPVAYEYQPDLILISAGYDAALGCPEGNMQLTPGFYSHFVQLLKGIADSRIVMVLEGGYFPPSLGESVALSVKGLFGDPCPILQFDNPPRKSVADCINNCKGALYKYWKCFSLAETFDFSTENDLDIHEEHVVLQKYFGEVGEPPFMIGDYYPSLTESEITKYSTDIKLYQKNRDNYREFIGMGFGIDLDTTCEHNPPANAHAYECPERLTHILEIMKEASLVGRCFNLKINRERSVLEYCSAVHDEEHMQKLLRGKFTARHDLYVCDATNKAAIASVTVMLSVVDEVMENYISNGVALIRPPGHHASCSDAQGFCFLNNVAIAAKYAQKVYQTSKILIVDFDIHHGNGTQDVFYLSDEVLYISIHRFDNGNFYPKKESANVNYVGHGPGEGFNVNIPFSGDIMGNSEYLAAFLNIVLPIGYAFKPQLVLVSAGFDAGINDPLGGYKVTPEMFGHFIYLLKPLARGRIILALEGGYNQHTTSYGMVMCMKALMNQPIPLPKDVFSKPISEHAARTIREVVKIQRQYWPTLLPIKKLSKKVLQYHYQKVFDENIYKLKKYSNHP